MDEVEVHVDSWKWFPMSIWAEHMLEREMLILGEI